MTQSQYEQPQHQQQPAFFVPGAQMKQIAKNRPVELINGFVPSGGVMVLAGTPGLGKSFTALSWAAAIAEGGQWFGRAARHAPVVYVLGEGFGGFGSRVEAWETANGRPIPEDLWFVDGLTFDIDLKDSEKVQQLINALALVQPGLVVFDTFSVLAHVSNENDNAEVAAVMSNVNKIVRATGATAMLIHHVTKASRTVRGASAFVGNADTVVVATEDLGDKATGDFFLSTETSKGGKQRDGEARTLYGFSIESPGVLTRNGGTSAATTAAPTPLDPNEIMAKSMAAHERQKDQEKGQDQDQEN